MSFKVAIIGLGQIGLLSDMALAPEEHVYTHARAFSQHPGFDLVAAVDGDPERRRQFEETYNVKAFDHIGEELGRLSPDVVAIAVPTSAHVAVLRQVLQVSSPRVILCEKPLSYDIEEARSIVSMCGQAGAALYVNYVRRADLAVRRIKSLIESGDISLPLKGVAWYSKGLFNNGSHFIDLLEHWLGPAQSFLITGQGPEWTVDPEPDVQLQFEGGQIQFLAAKEKDYSYYMIELISGRGRLRYDLGGEYVTWQAAVPSTTAAGYTVLETIPEVFGNDLAHIQWHVADQLNEAMHQRSTSICTGNEALNTIEFLNSIKKKL